MKLEVFKNAGFEIRGGLIDGEPVIYLKTRVTAKGQEYLISRLDEILEKQTA